MSNGYARIVIFGGVGFGIAWAIAGVLTSGFLALTLPRFQPPSPPPPEWVEYPSQLAYFVGRGAALGMSLKSWKRVITFAVAGAIGFGVGSIIFFVLAFLFGFPLVSVGMGALGGILLGLALADWRGVVLLGLAGMVGFGLGGAISTALGMPSLAFDWEQPPCGKCCRCWSKPWSASSGRLFGSSTRIPRKAQAST